ncbi:hypothetical protein [Streptomyces kebangsaanensis]|uniref:hypothetical protein n=1 Tax=Streptomyces kebangsaanensis TaxID=864058 RepID=UPI00093F87B1|nr:hypothetical protein [Streptomyces kebangsaanensis]
MDVLPERCAGVGISKKDTKACVRTPDTKRRGSFATETTAWGSTTNAVLALRDHLPAEDLNVILVNARQVKNLPGRKTDVSDAAWPAQLGAHDHRHGDAPPAPAHPPQPNTAPPSRSGSWCRA